MCTRTISHTRGMEYRPNSRTGPYMTGTVTDSGIGHTQRSADIAPDTDGDAIYYDSYAGALNSSRKTGTVSTTSLNDTYSAGLQKNGLLLHILPTTVLMRDSNLSTRGHTGWDCHHPTLWQKRASFYKVHRCTKHYFSTSSFVETFHYFQTLCHYRQFG